MTERVLEMILKAGGVLFAGGCVCMLLGLLACALKALWLLWGDMG